VGALSAQLTTLALWLLVLVPGLALGVLWNRAVEKRARRAELPREWRGAIDRTYGGKR